MRATVSGVFSLCMLAALQPGETHPSTETAKSNIEYRVAPAPQISDVPRLGVNLGSRTSWGAEQLMSNLLANPGFEPTDDGAIVVVRGVSGAEFTDDTPWLARPEHFWEGASFSVRTGRMAGAGGKIVESGRWESFPHFRADRLMTGLALGDVVALSRRPAAGGELPAGWWYENSTDNRIRTSTAHPSNSPGTQSLLLAPGYAQPVAAVSYLDMIGERAGKLLLLNGEWQIRFWAKAAGAGHLTVQCRRLNTSAFLRESLEPGEEWHEYRFRFRPRDLGSPAGLEFRLEAQGAGYRVWLDDASMAPVDNPRSGFRPEVVDTLRAMHPGYLRDWQGQLGDNFGNRIALEEARRPTRYRPGDEVVFGYSIPEFMELCREVGAEPWLVLPLTLDDSEWRDAGAYLQSAANNYGFHDIVVEFGNENWNMLFRPSGVLNAESLSQAAERAGRLMWEGSGKDERIKPVLGGQFVNPGPLGNAASSVPHAQILGIGPYYARNLKQGASDEDLLSDLFDRDDALLAAWQSVARASGKRVAIYEMNAHSLEGDADPERVSRLVTSGAAGSALLYHALDALEFGMTRQCVYSFAGLDTYRADGKLVRLFGLTRDLATAGRLRPTGLALEMANRAIGGQLFPARPVDPSDAKVPVVVEAFRNRGKWSVVAASGASRSLTLSIEIPSGPGEFPNTLATLKSASPLSGNEIGNEVVIDTVPIKTEAGRLVIHLGPFGAAAAYTEPRGVSNRNGFR